eukprot:9489922-Pyramimonas_sp.AAC.1
MGYDVDVKGYGVDVKGYCVDIKGYCVDVKGYDARQYLLLDPPFPIDASAHDLSSNRFSSLTSLRVRSSMRIRPRRYECRNGTLAGKNHH